MAWAVISILALACLLLWIRVLHQATALRFYANPANYQPNGGPPCRVMQDGGRRARRVMRKG